MTEKIMRKARSKVHELYQDDKLDFGTMCTLFDTLVEVEEGYSQRSEDRVDILNKNVEGEPRG